MRPTVFFDCDGVLNAEPGAGGVLTPADVHLIEGAARAVGRVKAAGALAIAVTNRSQLARGHVTRTGLDAILAQLRALLDAEGGRLDAVYACPHLPPPGPPGARVELVVECACRKPRPGLLERAARAWPVDRSRSVMIGDSRRDIGAAHAFGIPCFGVRTGHACAEGSPEDAVPDASFASVGPAADAALAHLGLA